MITCKDRTIKQEVTLLRQPRAMFVSLVERGANQRPFRVLKSDERVAKAGGAPSDKSKHRKKIPVSANTIKRRRAANRAALNAHNSKRKTSGVFLSPDGKQLYAKHRTAGGTNSLAFFSLKNKKQAKVFASTGVDTRKKIPASTRKRTRKSFDVVVQKARKFRGVSMSKDKDSGTFSVTPKNGGQTVKTKIGIKAFRAAVNMEHRQSSKGKRESAKRLEAMNRGPLKRK